MGWLKEIFAPTPETFYTYAMKHSRFLKRLSLRQTAEMHDYGQRVGAEYKYPTRLSNGMIGPPHSMFGEYLFLANWCDAEGDIKNREQLDVAFEKFGEEFSAENGYNFY